MADHNYCDNENVLKFTEPSISDNYESKCIISMSDDPEYGEVPKSGPQTKLKSKIKSEQSHSTWSPVRTAPGLRPNCTIFYDGNGFAYHNHKIANNKKYLKCTQKSIKKKPCPARAVIRNHDNMIRHSGEPHTHKPRNYDEDLLKRNFLMTIRERAINENTPNRAIFDEEIKKTPKLRGKVTFSSTARRMQRFRQPQKMQGPLFPIEDNELIDAINDFKNIPLEESSANKDKNVTNQECKPNILFDAENHMEVIEIDDIDIESNEYTDETENEAFNEKDGKENVSNSIEKITDKTVNMFCCIYCNKWQEPQIFEFVPNQKTKTIELKEKVEEKNVMPPINHSSPVPTDNSSENRQNSNQTSTLEYSEVHEDISQNNDDNKVICKQVCEDISQNNDNNKVTCKQKNDNVDRDIDIPETAISDTPELCKPSSLEKKKKVERKLGFLQMRIDSTIYFDNMGYSYQIQNEKNDKKYLRCVVWGKKKCPGRAHLNIKTLNIIRSRGHNHLPSSNCDAEKQARAFLHAIKQRAQDENTPLKTIYTEEIKNFPLANTVVNYANATRRMQRTRRLKNQPSTTSQKEPPLLLSVQVIPGTRRGTSLYLDELGYYYHNDTLTNSGKIVRCTKNRKTTTDEACHSRGYMRASGDGFVIYRTKEHNHPPGDLKRNPLERSFINTLCERARNELHLGLKDIYNEEVERFPDVADKIPYRMAWRSMARTRQPPKPSGEVKLVNVKVISGIWDGYTLYRDEIGFLYSMRKGRKFAWCQMNTKLKCLVKGSILVENDTTMLEFTGEHNHPPLGDDEFQAAIFLEKIMLKCLEDDSKPKKLYDEELVNFPGVEKRVTLSYAREKIKARRKSALKKNTTHEMLETICEPLQYVEFWDDDHISIDDDHNAIDDDFTEDVYSEDEDFSEKPKDSDDIYSDEQGFKFTIVSIKNETRYLECIMKYNGCDAKGEMFKGENDEWLFVLHSYPHNHLPDEDQSNN
ncbi:uncharacterized protein LOC112592611 [Melanaphis sacchari]|uniref:uncharacterized protein LOC112592611 n=1 Tax=Melanaphis sacchari TaxID=742174 RepID=UPI000DC149F6|nr:uncharacterized protein LOC112592611 [Melanaphis sacchari]